LNINSSESIDDGITTGGDDGIAVVVDEMISTTASIRSKLTLRYHK
jgi:hypothetical protein